MKIIAYNHTHWDREWYKTFQEFRLRFVEVMDLIIQELKNRNIDCFYLDGQTVIIEDYFELYPQKKSIVEDFIKQKKIIIGPWYALADEFLVSGESLFRNMQIGINQAKELGCYDFVGYLPDSFGHNSEIPRILSAFGIKNAVLWRGAGSQKSEFVWKSFDDSSVLATYLIEGYFQNILHYDISVEEKASKLKEFLDKIKKYSSTDCILLPVGGDHLGSVLNMKNQIAEIEKLLPEYSFEEGSILDYIEKINNYTEFLGEISEFKGELRDNTRNPILPGTLSTRLYLKQENAVSTWKLSKIAEPFYTFCRNAGFVSEKNNEFKYAWKLLLKNHPHDSICGCSIDEVHDEMMPRFHQVNQISDGLILRATNALSARIKKGIVWVYNSSDYDFSGVVKIKTNTDLPDNIEKQFIKSTLEFPKEILLDTQRPPFSEDIEEFKEYLIYADNINAHSIKLIDENYKYSKYSDKFEIGENFIKNSRVSIDINADGTLKFIDFELKKEYDGLHYFYDRADIGDTYNYAPLENDSPLKSKFLKTEIIEKGILRNTLRLFYEIEIPVLFDEKTNSRSNKTVNTVITSDISICFDSKRVDFNTFWNNSSKDHILQIKFMFNEKITETFAENTFGIIKRDFDETYNLKDNIPAKKGEELKTNTAPMQRFVCTQGLGVITQGLCEYGVNQNELYITILRSVGKLSKLSLNTRNFPAGPPLDTEGAQCLGEHSVRYSLCAVNNPSELFKHSDEFFGNIIADTGNGSSENIFQTDLNLLKINNENIYSYAVKASDNKENIVIRLLNLSENEQKVSMSTDLNLSFYTEVSGLEEPVSSPLNLRDAIVFKPYELKSILLYN